jgi:hypothetical protein
MMNPFKKFSIVFISILLFFPLISRGQQTEEEAVKIPKEVERLMEANLPTREPKLDIPLSYVETLYFPYQDNYYTVFFMKIKNQDLSYTAPFFEEKKKETKQEAKQEEQIQEQEQILSCNADFFFRIYSLGKDGQLKDIHKEVYLPYADQVSSKDYNPEEENVYSFGTIFPPGRYLLSASAASLDLTKIGLVYREFNLPVPSDFKKNLKLTPLFFVKSLKRMPSPDSAITLYKNLFHYATLEIEPYFHHEFGLQEKLDVLYFILGLNPGADGKFKFEVSYTYKKGEEDVVKFEPRVENVPAPLVSVPLSLSFEEKKLEPGEYTLEILIKDQNSKKEGLENIGFKVK